MPKSGLYYGVLWTQKLDISNNKCTFRNDSNISRPQVIRFCQGYVYKLNVWSPFPITFLRPCNVATKTVSPSWGSNRASFGCRARRGMRGARAAGELGEGSGGGAGRGTPWSGGSVGGGGGCTAAAGTMRPYRSALVPSTRQPTRTPSLFLWTPGTFAFAGHAGCVCGGYRYRYSLHHTDSIHEVLLYSANL